MSADARTVAAATVSSDGPAIPMLGTIFDELLRDRARLYARLEDREQLADLARALVLIIAGGAAAFGASVGAYKGGVQIVFAAIKLPLVLLLTAAVCAPSWSALRAAVGAPASITREVLRVLVGLAMVSLVLAALAPFMLVGMAMNLSYHTMALSLLACAATAGLVGVGALIASRRDRSQWVPLALFISLFVMVGAQMSWTLRPYLVRPRATETPFVRALEGSVIEAAATSWDSANGRYDRDYAPLPGEDEPGRIEYEIHNDYDGDGREDYSEAEDSWR